MIVLLQILSYCCTLNLIEIRFLFLDIGHKKKKYLQGKRGIEKPPFDPPPFIKDTGIMELRGSIIDKDHDKN